MFWSMFPSLQQSLRHVSPGRGFTPLGHHLDWSSLLLQVNFAEPTKSKAPANWNSSWERGRMKFGVYSTTHLTSSNIHRCKPPVLHIYPSAASRMSRNVCNEDRGILSSRCPRSRYFNERFCHKKWKKYRKNVGLSTKRVITPKSNALS